MSRTTPVDVSETSSSVRDSNGTPAWQLFPAEHVRSDGMPCIVSDPDALETPLLQRILKTLRRDFDPEFVIRWLGPVPHAPLKGKLAGARVGLVTTACLHLQRDLPFDPYSGKWGDPSYRLIPHLSPAEALDLDAEYVDETYVRKDPETALPMRALEHWVQEGFIGSAAARHVSFCEGVVRPIPGLVTSAREAMQLLRSDGVNAILLFPSCSLCVLNVCVIAREVEAAGLTTATVTLLPELTQIVGVPRSLAAKFPLGAPCGDPGNAALHRHVVRRMLERLTGPLDSGEPMHLDLPWRGQALV